MEQQSWPSLSHRHLIEQRLWTFFSSLAMKRSISNLSIQMNTRNQHTFANSASLDSSSFGGGGDGTGVISFVFAEDAEGLEAAPKNTLPFASVEFLKDPSFSLV